ncbi:MAG: hypothetical protein QX197_11910 [Methylococcaceae bacterium]
MRVCWTRYSIYLLHYMVAKAVLKLYSFAGFGVITDALLNVFLLIMPVTLVVADMSYRFVERPFMAMRGSYFK